MLVMYGKHGECGIGKNACETNARIDKQTSANFKVIDGKNGSLTYGRNGPSERLFLN